VARPAQASLAEVRHRVGPLLEEVRAGGLATSEGLSYLEAKHLLLLNYCIAITFYIMLKAEGRSVRDHPVIARLVQVRPGLWGGVAALAATAAAAAAAAAAAPCQIQPRPAAWCRRRNAYRRRGRRLLSQGLLPTLRPRGGAALSAAARPASRPAVTLASPYTDAPSPRSCAPT
jgi:hypothetical protein